MLVDIVIPARYASTRLPGKPLLRSTGKYLIQHVYEKALQSRRARSVIIATDDRRIRAAIESFGAPCVMTRRDHESGTDRIAEVAQSLNSDVIVNLQGDEPDTDPAHIDLLADLLQKQPAASMATLAVPLPNDESYRNPNCVKVVCDRAGRALYFSRSPIPHVRDGATDFEQRTSRFLQHVGIYAYRREFLLELAAQPVETLETLEKLEQLRALATGHSIQVAIISHAGRGIDTFDDYERFRKSRRAKDIRSQAA